MQSNLTELLAVYGALLSTVVFFWNLFRTRRKLKVVVMTGSDIIDGELKFGISVAIQNPSTTTVHVSAISILYPWEKTTLLQVLRNSFKWRRWFPTYGWVHCDPYNYDINDGCPISIEPGHAHRMLISLESLEELTSDAHSRTIIIAAQDQLSNTTLSKPFKLDDYIT